MLGFSSPCPCCRSWRTTLVYYHFDPKRTRQDREWYKIRGCRGCGVLWLAPLPTAREVNAYYVDGEGWESAKQVTNYADPNYRNSRKIEAFCKLHDLLAPSMNSELLANPNKSMLDFGCGPGWALDAFSEKGWTVAGVELAPHVRGFAQQRHRVLDKMPNGEAFDFILLNHALEHLRDPMAMLKSLSRRLKPNGYLYLGVPNFGALNVQNDTRPFISCHHLFAYTRESLTNLCAMAGLRSVLHLDSAESKELFQVSYRELRILTQSDHGRIARVPRPLAEAQRLIEVYRCRRDPRHASISIAEEMAQAKKEVAARRERRKQRLRAREAHRQARAARVLEHERLKKEKAARRERIAATRLELRGSRPKP